MDRARALEKVEREETNQARVRYTITYDSKLPHLPIILSKNWKVMIQTDKRLEKAFSAPPMACLRRGPNLQDKLVRARLPWGLGSRQGGRRQQVGRVVGFSCCKAGRKSCSLCPFTGEAADKRTVVTKVTIHHSGQVIPISQVITCRDTYCQYLLTCKKPGCKQQYWGCTKRPLYIRFAEHLDSVRDPDTTCTVGLHWRQPGHIPDHLEFLGVEKLGNPSLAVLREREKNMINVTGLLGAGMNVNL